VKEKFDYTLLGCDCLYFGRLGIKFDRYLLFHLQGRVGFQKEATSSSEIFNVHGSVHRNNILIYIEQDALHSLFYLETALHVSCGTTTHHQERKQLYLQQSGVCHTIIAICRYRGRVGTGLSVLWMAYTTHSTLKPVPTLPR